MLCHFTQSCVITRSDGLQDGQCCVISRKVASSHAATVSTPATFHVAYKSEGLRASKLTSLIGNSYQKLLHTIISLASEVTQTKQKQGGQCCVISRKVVSSHAATVFRTGNVVSFHAKLPHHTQRRSPLLRRFTWPTKAKVFVPPN